MSCAATFGKDGFDELCSYLRAVETPDGITTVVVESASKELFAALACLAAFAMVPSLLWTLLMIYAGGFMLNWGLLITGAAIGVGSGYVSWWMYAEGLAVSIFCWPLLVGAAFGLGVSVFLCGVQYRIEFAASNLHTGTVARKSFAAGPPRRLVLYMRHRRPPRKCYC